MSSQPPPPLLEAHEGTTFLLHFAQIHETFRQAEIDSLAALNGIQLEWVFYDNSVRFFQSDMEERRSADGAEQSPFAVVNLPSASAARTLVSRSVLAKGIHTVFSRAASYDGLHAQLKARMPAVAAVCMSCTFRFSVESYQRRRSARSQREVMDGFSYLSFDGGVDIRTPQLAFVVFEEFLLDGDMVGCALGLKVGDGAREAANTYDLKRRPYIGTTSMDAALSLVTANLALAASGRLCFDPFVGTGSFLVAAAHFGGTVVGSDIDGRQIRGRGGRSIEGNFSHYGLQPRLLDAFTSDLTNTPLRRGRWLDCILTDPPYGVREGLKVLGSRTAEKAKTPVMVGGTMGHLLPDYVPPKRPYGFMAMLADVLTFAREHLVDGGRIAFWMPVANEDGECEVPRARGLRLRHVCVQEFNKCKWYGGDLGGGGRVLTGG